MPLVIDETTFDSNKLSTDGISFTEPMPATDNTEKALEVLTGLANAISEIKSKTSIDSAEKAVAFNSLIDALESAIRTLQENLEGQINTLSSNVNTAIGANLSDITAKIEALNTWLDDNDGANAFVSLIDYIKSMKATINEIITKSTKVANGIVSIASPSLVANVLNVESGDALLGFSSVIVTEVVPEHNYIMVTKTAHNQYKFYDLRYPAPKQIVDGADLGVVKVHYRVIGANENEGATSSQKVAFLPEFETARPS